jgi:hypothetical protein
MRNNGISFDHDELHRNIAYLVTKPIANTQASVPSFMTFFWEIILIILHKEYLESNKGYRELFVLKTKER